MTSATASTGTRVRIAALAAGLVGALALTACGGGGGDHSSTDPSATASVAPTPSSSADGSGVSGASGKLQGSWLATSGGTIVALVINGKQAGIFATGGTVCSGTAGTESGMQMIHLTCAKGSKDRTTGMVDSVDGSSMKVTWSGKVGQETYTKAEGGKLPSGLPTAAAR
ncbi:hypothetical protein ACFYMX_37310 [Streptomyces griseofuscus]|uniref:hypothetical protein n=1 Tax=Streptomyces TaxID=1883 RepID=UPI00081EFD50|nr:MULTISPECIES: hypothetical protein [unclassified Streptomyces]SCF64418.1 hypothetical protein GA0115258_106611 [Streptomyces sp. LamerLS-31b]SCF98069.1 hypothetical protein GA0115256_138535 [Streptomyces sp. DconLS]